MSKTAEEFLENDGYDFSDKDFWMEELLIDFKFKDLVSKMNSYAQLKTSELEKEIEELKNELQKSMLRMSEDCSNRVHDISSECEKQLSEKDKENKELRELISKIPDLLHDSLGNRENEYIIKDLPENSCVDDGDFWIIHREVGSGEPLKQWIKLEIDKSLNK